MVIAKARNTKSKNKGPNVLAERKTKKKTAVPPEFTLKYKHPRSDMDNVNNKRQAGKKCLLNQSDKFYKECFNA